MISGKSVHHAPIGMALLETLESRMLLSAAVNCAAGVASAAHKAAAHAIGNVTSAVEKKASGAIPGDANGDGLVDVGDFNIWFSSVGKASAADFNHDGITDLLDFNIWFANLGGASNSTAAPVSYDWHEQTINGVLNVWVPNPTDFGNTWTVTDPSELFGSDGVPNLASIHQGGIADCYFLSAAGSLALTHPSQIMQEVQNDPAGGWMVTYQYSSMGKTVPVIMHTSNQLSSTWQTEANGEVWDLVMEKTYAAFRTFNGISGTNTMASIGWGFGSVALTQLGETNMPLYTGGQTVQAVYTTLSNAIAANRPVLFPTSPSAPTMVQSHVYVITSVYSNNGVPWATLYNPWGFYDSRPISELLQNTTGSINIGIA